MHAGPFFALNDWFRPVTHRPITHHSQSDEVNPHDHFFQRKRRSVSGGTTENRALAVLLPGRTHSGQWNRPRHGSQPECRWSVLRDQRTLPHRRTGLVIFRFSVADACDPAAGSDPTCYVKRGGNRIHRGSIPARKRIGAFRPPFQTEVTSKKQRWRICRHRCFHRSENR